MYINCNILETSIVLNDNQSESNIISENTMRDENKDNSNYNIII